MLHLFFYLKSDLISDLSIDLNIYLKSDLISDLSIDLNINLKDNLIRDSIILKELKEWNRIYWMERIV